jgi:hypothetical protein
MRRLVLLAVAVAQAAATSAVAQDVKLPPPQTIFPGVSFSSGLDYSAGRYGDTHDTDILVGLTNVTVSEDDFQFSASMPYLNITGPAYVVVGPGGAPVLINPAKGAGSTVRSGWGDLNFSASYTLPSDALDDFEITGTFRTKIATANASKGLSTGATDFAFSVDVSKQFDAWGPFATFAYRVPGEPSFYSFNDAPSFSVGTSIELADNLVAIASYDFDGSISTSLADAQQLFGSVTWLATDKLSLTAYFENGLSSGAPRVGTGLLISWKVN